MAALPGTDERRITRVSPRRRTSDWDFSGRSPTRAWSFLPALGEDLANTASRTVPGIRYVVYSASAHRFFPSISVTRMEREAPRASLKVIRSPGPSLASHRPGTGRHAFAGHEGVSGLREGVRKIRAGETTRPYASRRGRYFRTAGPGCSGPVRSLGPPKSIWTRHLIPVSILALSRFEIMAAHSVGPSC